MFQSRIFSFRLLADNDQIDVVVPTFDARHTPDVHYIGVQVQRPAQFHVQRLQLTGSTVVRCGQGSCLSKALVEFKQSVKKT